MAEAQEESGRADADIYVMEENWDTVMVFTACRTLWRRHYPPMGGPVIWEGLIPSEVDVVIRRRGHQGARADEIFAGVQVMEAAALAVFHPPEAEAPSNINEAVE